MNAESSVGLDVSQNPVVLADDDPDDRFMITRALHRVRPALGIAAVRDGIELIEHLRSRIHHELPQLVLLDLNMPRMDGREVLRALRADAALQQVPVVVLTTSVESMDATRAVALGAVQVLSKPDGFGALVDVMRRLLDQYVDLANVGRTPCPSR